MKYVPPRINGKAFHCPLCGTYAHMDWQWLNEGNRYTDYLQAKCSHCDNASLWRATKKTHGQFGPEAKAAEMLFPDFGSAPLPEQDMPPDVKRDYVEAATIAAKSPRGAAALLRLALQKLCKHLGEKGKNINEDIRSLASKNVLPPMVIKVADTVRITGNNAVHPGEMSDDDFDHVASKMFGLLNFVVVKAINEPRELELLYKMTPEAPRKDAEARDANARRSKATGGEQGDKGPG